MLSWQWCGKCRPLSLVTGVSLFLHGWRGAVLCAVLALTHRMAAAGSGRSGETAVTWCILRSRCVLASSQDAHHLLSGRLSHEPLVNDAGHALVSSSEPDPYLGEQHDLSMRLWTLSSEVEMCRDRADANGFVVDAVGRGDQALDWSPLLLGTESVWSPTLTE